MTGPDVAHIVLQPTAEASAVTRAGERPVDVLILTALQDELDAVLALGAGGRAGWDERKGQVGFRCYRRCVDNGRGGMLGIAAAWSGEMGAYVTEAYLTNGQNLEETARQTGLHRQTVRKLIEPARLARLLARRRQEPSRSPR